MSYINTAFLWRLPAVRKKHYLVQRCRLSPGGQSLIKSNKTCNSRMWHQLRRLFSWWAANTTDTPCWQNQEMVHSSGRHKTNKHTQVRRGKIFKIWDGLVRWQKSLVKSDECTTLNGFLYCHCFKFHNSCITFSTWFVKFVITGYYIYPSGAAKYLLFHFINLWNDPGGTWCVGAPWIPCMILSFTAYNRLPDIMTKEVNNQMSPLLFLATSPPASPVLSTRWKAARLLGGLFWG